MKSMITVLTILVVHTNMCKVLLNYRYSHTIGTDFSQIREMAELEIEM